MVGNRGRRKFVAPGIGSALVAPEPKLRWNHWEGIFGVTIGSDVRTQVESAISVYRANAAFADQDADAVLTKADFKRRLSSLLSRYSKDCVDLFGDDWKIFRLVLLLTPEMSGFTKERISRAVARFEIDCVHVVREIDAFSDAVTEICGAFSSIDPRHGRLTSLKWDDEASDPKPIDQFLGAVLRSKGCDLAQVKSHRRALKRKEKRPE
jgi:hypothetical protein